MTTTVEIAFISVAALVFSAQAAESPTCEFGPNKDTPETLTFTFAKDLKESRLGFIVKRFCFSNGLDPERVLTCEWSDDQGHICHPVSPGYSFNASTISNKIVLGIECLTRDIDGNYSCQQLPLNNGVENMCHYKHLDAPKNSSCVIERIDNTLEKLNCTFGVDLGQQKHGFNVHRYEENQDPAIVLSCIWTKGIPGPICYVAPWYTFDNSTISTNIVLQNLTKGGNYMCQLIPRVCEDNIQKPCKHDNATMKAMCVFEPNTEKPENLTCTCGGDAEKRKHNFSVYVIRYGKNPAVVWSCNWKEDQPTCNDSEGFTFDKSIVSSRLVLEINPLTMIDLEGVYRCHVILPLGEYDSNQTCNNTRDGNDQEGGLTGGYIAGIVICVVVGVVLVGGIGLLVFHLRNRRRGQDVHEDPAATEMVTKKDTGQDDHDDPA